MNKLNSISESELFQSLSRKLGQKETKLLIKYVSGKSFESEQHLATKEDIADLSKEISQVQVSMSEKLQSNQRVLFITIITVWLTSIGLLVGLALLK